MQKTFSDKMRWLAILGAAAMLMTHANTLAFYPNALGWPALLVQFGANLAVPAVAWFFFSAAYWFFRGLQWQNLFLRLKRRFFSLVVPFVLWNALVLLAETARQALHGGGLPTAQAVLQAFYPLAPINGALWFVARLVSYMILAPIIYPLLQHQKLGLAVCGIVTVFAVGVNADYYSFLYWLPVFLAGGWIGLHHAKDFEKTLAPEKGNLPWAAGLLAFLALMAVAYAPILAGGRAIYLVRLAAIPALVLLARWVRVPHADGWLAANLSFYMFCTHWYLDGLAAGKIAALIPPGIPGAVLLGYLAVCAAVFCTVLLSLNALHRFAPRLCAVLTGDR